MVKVTGLAWALACGSLAELELHFPEFLSPYGSGLGVAARGTGTQSGR